MLLEFFWEFVKIFLGSAREGFALSLEGYKLFRFGVCSEVGEGAFVLDPGPEGIIHLFPGQLEVKVFIF